MRVLCTHMHAHIINTKKQHPLTSTTTNNTVNPFPPQHQTFLKTPYLLYKDQGMWGTPPHQSPPTTTRPPAFHVGGPVAPQIHSASFYRAPHGRPPWRPCKGPRGWAPLQRHPARCSLMGPAGHGMAYSPWVGGASARPGWSWACLARWVRPGLWLGRVLGS